MQSNVFPHQTFNFDRKPILQPLWLEYCSKVSPSNYFHALSDLCWLVGVQNMTGRVLPEEETPKDAGKWFYEICDLCWSALAQQRIKNSFLHWLSSKPSSSKELRQAMYLGCDKASMNSGRGGGSLSPTPKMLRNQKSSDAPPPSVWHVDWTIFLYVNHGSRFPFFFQLDFHTTSITPHPPWHISALGSKRTLVRGEGAKTILPKYNFSPQSRISCP